jgi:hypothetical protein
MVKNVILWTNQIELLRSFNGKSRYYTNGKQLMNPANGDVIIVPTLAVVDYYGGAKHTPIRILKKAKLVKYEDDPHSVEWGAWTGYYEGTLVSEWFQSFINLYGNPFNTRAAKGYCNQYMSTFIQNLTKKIK